MCSHFRGEGLESDENPVEPVEHSPQPARKASLTARVALSALGSSKAIDCHVPNVKRPPTTGIVTDGEATIDTK